MTAAVFLTALVLLIWFQTDAFNEYCVLFGLDEFFYLREYNSLEAGHTLSYPDFLLERNRCFITKLLSCPICSSTWLGIILSLFVGLWSMPIISVLGLMVYLVMVKLL